MSSLVVIQARMGSSRLPGKVVSAVHGSPLLAVMLHRLRRLAVDQLIVATSIAPADIRVVEIAEAAGVEVVRGSEKDVLGRFGDALDHSSADVVVRLTADCPLADPEIVLDAIARRAALGVDYLSNTLVRTYPDGLDVEVISSSALREAIDEATEPDEREHVTPFLYRRPHRYHLGQLTTPEDAGDERWTVDTPEDLAWLRDALSPDLVRTDLGWIDLLAIFGRRADRSGLHLRTVDAGPHAAGSDFRRAWAVHLGETRIGEVALLIDDGRARFDRSLDPGMDEDAVLEMVKTALELDAQVVELEEDPWTKRT